MDVTAYPIAVFNLLLIFIPVLVVIVIAWRWSLGAKTFFLCDGEDVDSAYFDQLCLSDPLCSIEYVRFMPCFDGDASFRKLDCTSSRQTIPVKVFLENLNGHFPWDGACSYDHHPRCHTS